MPLADRIEPLIVDLGQEVAAVEVDRLVEVAAFSRLDEGVDVEPEFAVAIPGDLLVSIVM